MELFHAPEAVIDQFLGINRKEEDLAPPSIDVWDDCWDSYLVFSHTQPELLAGFAGIVWAGVTCVEVFSACMLLHIPRKRWPLVLDDVQYMASVSARLNNDARPRR